MKVAIHSISKSEQIALLALFILFIASEKIEIQLIADCSDKRKCCNKIVSNNYNTLISLALLLIRTNRFHTTFRS